MEKEMSALRCMRSQIKDRGIYRIHSKTGMFSKWVYFLFRIYENGIIEVKDRSNKFYNWRVISSLPKGCEIIH